MPSGHTVTNPGGSDDSSFCANSACHGIRWQYADLDAPALVERLGLQPPTPTPIPTPVGGKITYADPIGPLLTQRCGACHGQAAGLDVTRYQTLMAGSQNGPVVIPGDPEGSRIVQVLREGHFASLSSEELDLLIAWIRDGAPEGVSSSATPAPSPTPGRTAPAIPHPLSGYADCLACHGLTGTRPFPANHAGFSVQTCQNCHPAGPAGQPAKAIPHPLEGHGDCLACHALSSLPSSHQAAQFTNANCLLCHTVGGEQENEDDED